MKTIISCMTFCMLIMPAMSATGRVGVKTSAVAAASPAKVASVRVKPVVADNTSSSNVDNDTNKAEVDRREKEKMACMSNNIGVGNTFVWASRYSNTNDYSTMIEDMENPENNTCFVRVALKSSDSRINVSDIPAQYYEMGRNITCGAWADEDKIEKRILDAKKKGRTWATVGGVVGGAALGVGSMELFGNKLIGGKVQGQKSLSGNELLRSQLLVMQKEDKASYDKFVSALKELKEACGSDTSSSECSEYSGLYDLAN